MPRAIVTREPATRDLNRYIKKVGNAVVFADSAGKLSLLYVTVSIGGWSGSSLNLTSSIDGGGTWSQSQRLTLSPFFNLSELAKNAPAALVSGSWAVPIYHELISTFPEVLWLDETEKGVRVTKSRVSAGWFGYQPALTPLTASTALAVLRNDDDSKAVSVARTDDGGEPGQRRTPSACRTLMPGSTRFDCPMAVCSWRSTTRQRDARISGSPSLRTKGRRGRALRRSQKNLAPTSRIRS